MSDILNAISFIFNGVLKPLIWLGPLFAITVVSLITAVVVLVIYKYFSNQSALTRIKASIKADLLAIGLYKDSMKVLFTSAGNIFLKNFRYLQLNLTPLIMMLPLIILVMANLEVWYGHRGLLPGEHLLAKVTLAPSVNLMETAFELKTSDNLKADPYPVRILSKNEINWRIHALKEGEHELNIDIGDARFSKKVIVAKHMHRIPIFFHQGKFWDALLYPGEPAIQVSTQVQSIELTYPEGDLNVLGFKMHWIIYFFIAVTVLALLLKGRFRVTF